MIRKVIFFIGKDFYTLNDIDYMPPEYKKRSQKEFPQLRINLFYEKAILLLIASLCLISPVIFDYFQLNFDTFFTIKEVSTQILILSLFLVLLIYLSKRFFINHTKAFLPTSAFNLPFLFLLIVVGCSVITSGDYLKVAFYHGYNLLLYLIFFWLILVFFKIHSPGNRIKQVHFLIFINILIAGLIGFYCVLQYLGLDPIFVGRAEEIRGRYLATGFLGNPVNIAAYLAIFIPISVAYTISKKGIWSKIFYLILTFSSLAGLLCTQTRTAFFALFVSFIWFTFLIFWKHNKAQEKLKLSIIFIGLILFGLAFFLYESEFQHRLIYIFQNPAEALGNRLFPWWLTLEMMRDFPLAGLGLASFKFYSFDYQCFLSAYRLIPWDMYQYPAFLQAHNEPLQVAAELGFPGLLSISWILIIFFIQNLQTLKKSSHEKRRFLISEGSLRTGLIAGLLTLIITSWGSFPFHIAPTALSGILILALLEIKKPAKEKDSVEPTDKKHSQNYKNRSGFIKYSMIVLSIWAAFYSLRILAAEYYFAQGKDATINKNYSEALKKMEKTIKLNPAHNLAAATLAYIYGNQKDYQTAAKYFALSMRITKNKAIFNSAGYTNEILENYALAEWQIQRALLFDPFYEPADKEILRLYSKEFQSPTDFEGNTKKPPF